MRAYLLIAVSVLAPCGRSQRVNESPEPNASTTTATLLSCGEEAVGHLSSLLDEDWYEVTVPPGVELWVATGPGPGVAARDTVITLLDATGGPLRQSDDRVQAGWYSELHVTPLPAATYFIAVSAGAHAVSGSYQLDLACVAPPGFTGTPPVVVEGPENNDPLTGGNATGAIVPLRGTGALVSTGFDGDWDFWRVLVLGDAILRVRLAATATIGGGAADDPVVYLFDAATPPNVVAGPFYASDRGAWDQALDLRVDGGIHQVAVRGVEGSQPGSYLLDVTASPVAQGAVLAGGCSGRSLSLPTATHGPGTPRIAEYPRLGSTYTVAGSSLGALGYCFYAVGLQAQFVDLASLGAPGCALEVVPLYFRFKFADSLGQAAWSVTVPGALALLGTQLHSQVAVFDLSNALGITMSNRVYGVVGR